MIIGIVAAAIGVLLSAAALGIPQLVRLRSRQPDDQGKSRAYLEATGRSAREVTADNAAWASEYKNDIRPGWLDR
jgi:hypothetical protein